MVIEKVGFGKKLKMLRESRNLTRRELADALGINENTLTGYENSGREPKYDLLVKIADYFDVLVDELIRDPDLIEIPIQIISDDEYGFECSVTIPITEAEKNSFGLLKKFVDAFDTTMKSHFWNEYFSKQKKSTKLNLHYDIENLIFNLDFQIAIKEENLNGENVDN